MWLGSFILSAVQLHIVLPPIGPSHMIAEVHRPNVAVKWPHQKLPIWSVGRRNVSGQTQTHIKVLPFTPQSTHVTPSKLGFSGKFGNRAPTRPSGRRENVLFMATSVYSSPSASRSTNVRALVNRARLKPRMCTGFE